MPSVPRVSLPPIPQFRLEVVEDRSPPATGFLRIRRLLLRATMPDGSVSEPFVYDAIDRASIDAVVIVPHHLDANGCRWVWLRSCVRPPVSMRSREGSPVPEVDTLGMLWEVPAGLVEASERSPEGLVACAARELYEEVGVQVPASEIRPLGPSTFPAPGIIAERHFYFHVAIDPTKMGIPAEDGSVLERQALIISLPLEQALDLVRAGQIEDAKTETALRRLMEI